MQYHFQKIIPQHCVSRFLGKLANARLGLITSFGIKKFIQYYHVDMSEAQIENYLEFKSFNDFFTRELKNNARIFLSDHNILISPVDGCVSECGYIEEDRLLQAKGAYFNLFDLCGGDENLNKTFMNGAFLTAYLAPRDYHRFHLPIAGKLLEMIYVPGELFSVNQSSVKNIPGLFARNERVICIFETQIGKIALIAVGAMIVGSMSMKWHGIVAPQKKRSVTKWNYHDQSIVFERGDEIGHFCLGSTVIILCEQDKIRWNASMRSEKKLQLGETIADCS